MRLNALLQDAAAKGRGGDTILAHINPREAAMLKAAGGAGTINPETGLPEFYEGGFFDGPGFGGPDSGAGAGGIDQGGGAPDNAGTDYLGNQGQDVIGDGNNGDRIPGAPADGVGPNEWTGQQRAGWVGAYLGRIADRPAESAVNAIFGLVPGFGTANSILGLLGGPTVGSLTTSAVRDVTGYNETDQGNSSGSGVTTGPSGDPQGYDGNSLPGRQANDPGGNLDAQGYVNALLQAAGSADAPSPSAPSNAGSGGGGGGGGASTFAGVGSYGGYTTGSAYDEWLKRMRRQNQLVA